MADRGSAVLSGELVTRAPRPDAYRPTRYEGFIVSVDTGRTYPLRLDREVSHTRELERQERPCAPPATLKEAVGAALRNHVLNHKDKLVIKATDEATGKATLHLYAVRRKSAPDYVWRNHVQVREHRLYVEPICDLSWAVLAGEVE